MNRYYLISFLSLLALVVALPIYALLENERLDQARLNLQEQFIDEGVEIYVTNCQHCHGTDGSGIGAMPALNNPALADASSQMLHNVIAHSPHGSAMAAWHVEGGGLLNDFQVQALITLIQHGDWTWVNQVAANRPANPVALPVIRVDEAFLRVVEGGGQADPHECVVCHEEPAVHASQFGPHCARCHTLQSWTPALLTYHTFDLNHGNQGTVACQTCHLTNYITNTCYGCHDHLEADMAAVHQAEGLLEYDDCAACHPTGRAGEAAELMGINTVLGQGADQFGYGD
jgi:hypothetical protein